MAPATELAHTAHGGLLPAASECRDIDPQEGDEV
jgi:hypothetical protein